MCSGIACTSSFCYDGGMTKHHSSGNLFARPSFLEGMARTLDIGATLQVYSRSHTERKADTKALTNDWNTVGQDLRASLAWYEQTQKQVTGKA